ncbi:endonuclease domain-containing protein [Streptomyces sp. NPDC051172]|uniref:endonuclease domain-containing protein n=1 Tax=Streptomyces sp. NPDC051172 TaxID=3155796 RepID=UPI003447F403
MTRGHTSCYSHAKYALTCGEYEVLLLHADGHCTLCTKQPRAGRPLNIDHDHALGQWAVRGLVCDRCNQILRRVEAGEYPGWLAVRLYLDNPWHATQPSSGAKAAREKPRAECPACGTDVAVYKNGSLARHQAIGRRDGKCWAGTCPGMNEAPATVEILREKGRNVIPMQAAHRPKPSPAPHPPSDVVR